MNKTIGVCAVGWAAAWLDVAWQDAVNGAWPGVACVALAPAALWAVSLRRCASTAIRAAAAEAAAWQAR